MATILVGLRELQFSINRAAKVGSTDDGVDLLKNTYQDYFIELRPLSSSQIDDLCERVNTDRQTEGE